MIIGLSGKSRSGKDTLASFLSASYELNHESFAGTLKEAVKVIFGFTDEQVYGTEKLVEDQYWGSTPVEILQLVGTNLFREHYDPNIWVRALMRRILNNPTKSYIITDVRFPNEAEAVRELGGLLVRIDRPRELRGDTGRDDNHSSEVALDDYPHFDVILDNAGNNLAGFLFKAGIELSAHLNGIPKKT